MALHPYTPQSIQLPDYVPGKWSYMDILSVFGVFSSSFILLAWFASGKVKHLSKLDRVIVCWWICTGAIHFFIEGAYSISPKFYASHSSDFFTETWKEYSKADSRYALRDSFIVSVETFTSFIEGPSCFLAVYAIISRKPYRDLIQILISSGQLYGDILYFATNILDGFVYTDPNFLYFWVYFVFMNAIWIVIPFLIIVRSWSNISSIVFKHDKAKKKSS